MVTLREVSSANLHAVLALEVAASQRPYTHSVAYSIAEGTFPPDDDPVWMRAIYAADKPVGFLMTSEAPDQGTYFLWRILVDANHQGRGYGREAVQQLIDRIERTGNARLLVTSHVRANSDAGRFFQGLGFEYTGAEVSEGDLEMRLRFDR